MTTSLAHKDVHVIKGLCGVGGFVFRSSNVDVWTVMVINIRCVSVSKEFCSQCESSNMFLCYCKSKHHYRKVCVHVRMRTLWIPSRNCIFFIAVWWRVVHKSLQRKVWMQKKTQHWSDWMQRQGRMQWQCCLPSKWRRQLLLPVNRCSECLDLKLLCICSETDFWFSLLPTQASMSVK